MANATTTTRTLTTLAADWDQDQSAHGYGDPVEYRTAVRRSFDELLDRAATDLGADNLYRQGTEVVIEGEIDGDDGDTSWVQDLVEQAHDIVIEAIESAE